MSQRILLYKAYDYVEARLVVNELELAGVAAEVHRYSDPETGWIKADVYASRPSQLEAAQRVLAAYRTRRESKAERPDVACGHCGEQNPANFELCWSCRADL